MAPAFSLRRAALGAAVLSACVPCFAAAAQPLPTPAQLAALAFPGWSESAAGRVHSATLPPLPGTGHGLYAGWNVGTNRVLVEPKLVLRTDPTHLTLIAGLAPVGLSVFLVLSLCLSVFLGGGHYAIQSIIGIFYPSTLRASGSGWAGSVAKIGSMLGPLVGGYVLSMGLPLRAPYALLAICPSLFLLCVLGIGVIERRLRRAEAAARWIERHPYGPEDPEDFLDLPA